MCTSKQTGHTIEDNSFNIIGKGDQGQARTIKESIYIRVNNPNLNQNIGKYNLSHIWDRVLFNTIKHVHGLAPKYLCDKIQCKPDGRPGLHSSNELQALVVPRTKHKTCR